MLFQKNHTMAIRVFDTDEVLNMPSDDSDMEVDEKSDFFESDMEFSIDGSSDDGEDTDDGSSSEGDAHSWKAWRMEHGAWSIVEEHGVQMTQIFLITLLLQIMLDPTCKAPLNQNQIQLVGNLRNRKAKRGRTSKHDVAERLNKMSNFIAKAARGRSNGNRKTTVFFCKTCQRKPGLHPEDCFKNYLTMANYKQ